MLAALFTTASAQQPKPSPSPTPQKPEDTVKVFTEEVRLPVQALDSYGHYDPTLELSDILVLEDGVAQQLRSVTHVPAHVLFILDTGGELSGLGGMRSEEHTSELQSQSNLVCRLLLEKKNREDEGQEHPVKGADCGLRASDQSEACGRVHLNYFS